MPFSRRQILAGTLGAISLPALAASKLSVEPIRDLVIVGAGAAGLTAACLAAEQGIRRILILESEPLIGGSSLICGGFWAVSGTRLQKNLGVSDNDAAFFDDILEVGAHRNDPSLVRAFIENNRAQYVWVNRKGVLAQTLAPGAGTLRAHVFDARQLIARLYRLTQNYGVEIRTGKRVRNIVTDSEGRGVRGVETDSAFFPARAVLLACGGFSRNKAMLSKYSPQMRFVSTIAAQGCRGDGIIMAQELGAGLADMQWLQASYAFLQNPTTIADMTFVNYHGGIIVNKEGRRFVDESLPYKLIAREVLKQSSARSFIVFDERIRRISERQPMDQRQWSRVPMASASTLAQAAPAYGIDAQTLTQTVANYNRAVLRGEDAQRGPISVNGGRLLCIEQPPLHILPVTLCLLGTYCGIKINARAQVLREDNEPIPRLWAAGEVTGGFHGASFIMGTAFGKAQTFARIAALDIAQTLREM